MALIFALLLISLFFILSPGFLLSYLLTDIGMRLGTAVTGGSDNLQAWAVEILQKPQEEVVENGSMNYLKTQFFSKQVHRFETKRVYVVPKRQDEQSHIAIIWGSGFHHWGILVGPRTFHTVSNDHQHVYRWRDGVYGYHEIQ
jgi:hypothetical protein